MRARSSIAIMVSSVVACGCAVNDQSKGHCATQADCQDDLVCSAVTSTCTAPTQPPMMARGFTYGDTTGTDESATGSNWLVGIPIQIPTDGILIGIGFITVKAEAQHLYLGLYSDDHGQPGTVIQASHELTVTTGTNEVVVPNTRISAGTYWMMENSDGTTHFVSDGHLAQVKVVTEMYGPIPPAFSGSFDLATGKAPDVFVRMLHWTDYGL